MANLFPALLLQGFGFVSRSDETVKSTPCGSQKCRGCMRMGKWTKWELKHRLAESCPPCLVLAASCSPFASSRKFRFLFLLNARYARKFLACKMHFGGGHCAKHQESSQGFGAPQQVRGCAPFRANPALCLSFPMWEMS